MKKIVVVDFGGQYAHLIARRIREIGVYSEIQNPHAIKIDDDAAGLIFSGGPRSVTDEDMLSADLDLLNLPVPLLGICYGHQLIAAMLGGKVHSQHAPEYGKITAETECNSPLFLGTPGRQQVWMSHGDSVCELPAGFSITASTTATPIAGYQHTSRNIFGIQFHPEVTHTEHGMNILQNFVRLCTTERSWSMDGFEQRMIAEIQARAQGKKLLLLISGGVDSLVALALCIKAVGNDRIQAVHVDTGFMRYQESDMVMNFLTGLGFKNITLARAGERFFNRLACITDPEEKRKIIGGLFVDVMHEALRQFDFAGEPWALVQGTIYPDTIESGGTAQAAAIKTHHNRVSEIEDLIAHGRVIEPLKELYKDEVRQLGRLLQLPDELVQRRPFPGPGLAIRILCSNAAPDSATIDGSASLQKIAAGYGLEADILPVKSVGVQGDFRTYRHPAVLWNSAGYADWKDLLAASNKIINSVQSVNRAVFAPFGSFGTLHLKPVQLTEDRVKLLQLVDDKAQKLTADIKSIWQMPVISLPLFDDNGGQAFVLRPVCSQDAMTADVFEMEMELLRHIIDEIRYIPGTGPVFYDITTKPPATIEWE